MKYVAIPALSYSLYGNVFGMLAKNLELVQTLIFLPHMYKWLNTIFATVNECSNCFGLLGRGVSDTVYRGEHSWGQTLIK